MKGYPRNFKKTLYASSALLYFSGAMLAPTTLSLRYDYWPGWRLGPDARIGMGAAHLALALFFVALMGALWSLHMRAGWHRHLQRRSGALLVGSCVVLAASAVGVYYLADETLSNLLAFIHLLIGALLLIPFLWHALWHYRHPRSATPNSDSVNNP